MRELMSNGILAALNERIDFNTAAVIAEDLGFKAVLNGDLLQLEPNYSSGTTAYLIKGSFFPPSVYVLYKNEIHKKIPLPEMIDRLQNIDWQKTYVK